MSFKNLLLVAIIAASIWIAGNRAEGTLSNAVLIACLSGSFAALVVWISKSLRKSRYEKSGTPAGEHPVDVVVVLEVDASRENVMAECINAIQSLPNVDLKKIKSTSNSVVDAKTRSSWWTWGEYISADVQDNGRLSIVRLRSRPTIPWVLNDWGMSFQNIYRIVHALRRNQSLQVLESNVSKDFWMQFARATSDCHPTASDP